MAEKKTASNKKKPMTKNAVFAELATGAELTKTQVGKVFDGLTTLIQRELGKKGPGVFTIPGLIKVRLAKKKATKEREGRNPSTGEKMMIPAKPASTVVRARVLKGLTELVK
jgi:nucleoid DNA-binding protein